MRVQTSAQRRHRRSLPYAPSVDSRRSYLKLDPVRKLPFLSVVMPVYNALPFLDESINSVLAQTLEDFEFIIIDDGSTDGSAERLREWARRDRRICLYHSPRQLGLSGSSNMAVSRARTSIIARMDADDIAHPNRLRRQCDILLNRHDVVVLGTLYNGIDTLGREVHPSNRWNLLHPSPNIPFPHGTALFRREVFEHVGGYDETLLWGEEKDLFSRMADRGRVLTLPEVHYSYRYHSDNATRSNCERAVEESQCNGDDPLAVIHGLCSMRLWAGDPPMLLELMLKAKSLNWDAKTLKMLVVAICGHLSPHAHRALLRSSMRLRDVIAGLRLRDGTPVEWRSA